MTAENATEMLQNDRRPRHPCACTTSLDSKFAQEHDARISFGHTLVCQNHI